MMEGFSTNVCKHGLHRLQVFPCLRTTAYFSVCVCGPESLLACSVNLFSKPFPFPATLVPW